MTNLLNQTIEQYRAQHGKPEYCYFKKHIAWSKPRRQRGYHIVPIGGGEEVSVEEYEASLAESKKCETDAFMGRLERSYWRYDRKLVKDGWREVLLKEIQAVHS